MSAPLKNSYPMNIAIVVATLFPQLINTAAYPVLEKAIARDLHVPPANVLQYPLFNEAAFVFGILIGTAFIRRYNVRTVFLCMLAADVVFAVLLASGVSDWMMIVVNVAAGWAGGVFLMVALPPLFTNFDPKYFPGSAALMVPCLFGAATLAPVVCAPLAQAGLWRPLFWGEAAVLALGFLAALFTIAPNEPKQAGMPVDWFAISTGAFSMACVFAGVSNAAAHPWTYAPAIVPFVAGVAGFVVLIAIEYRKDPERALLPMSQVMAAFAIIGFAGAAAGNAIYVADTEIFNLASTRVLALEPMQIAATAWPWFVMTIITGVLFALVLKTKWVPVYTLSGLVAICIGSGLLFANLLHRGPAAQWSGLALIGYGAGATITPGLFTVGLSLPRDIIVRAIASVEVVRLTLGFISGPLTAHSVAMHTRGTNLLGGIEATMPYIIGFAALAAVVVGVLLLKYYRNPQVPDIVRYVKEGKPAFQSPPL